MKIFISLLFTFSVFQKHAFDQLVNGNDVCIKNFFEFSNCVKFNFNMFIFNKHFCYQNLLRIFSHLSAVCSVYISSLFSRSKRSFTTACKFKTKASIYLSLKRRKRTDENICEKNAKISMFYTKMDHILILLFFRFIII